MRLSYLLLASTLFLGGCIGNMALDTMSASENNMYNLWRISKGMSQSRVLQIMHKPFEYETFQFDQDTFDVWFYITRMTGLGQTRMVPQNLTPLTFKNGVLVDVGWVYYNYLLKEEDIRAKIAARPAPSEASPSQEPPENMELEKALQTPPGGTATPATPAQPAKPAQPAPISPTPPKTKPSQPVKNQPTQPSQPTQKPAPISPDKGQGYAPKNQLPGQPTKPTPPPQNQLPGQAPNYSTPPSSPNPSSSPSSTPPSQKVSMCSKPRVSQREPTTPESDEAPPSSSQVPSSQDPNQPPPAYKWNSEDQRMKEQDSEEDFDYW